jgi:hypothetical protein
LISPLKRRKFSLGINRAAPQERKGFMSICRKILVLELVLVALGAVGAYAQDKSDTSSTSLGDLARQVKAQKAKEPKPAKVFTNDNLTPPKQSGFDSDVNSWGKNSSTSGPQGSGGTTPAHDEKYFRERMSTLQGQLDTHQRELNVLQQKLGQNNMQYYPNPQDSLMQQYTREDINKLNADIVAKKKQIDDDQKAIDDLHEQLRQEGGDPAWLR